MEAAGPAEMLTPAYKTTVIPSHKTVTTLTTMNPLIPKFAGSNPTEAVGFLKGDKKSSARLPSEGK